MSGRERGQAAAGGPLRRWPAASCRFRSEVLRGPVGSLAAMPNGLRPDTDAGAARTTGPRRRPRIGTPRPRNGRRAARAGRGSPGDVEQGHGASAPANPRGLRASPKDRRPRASRGAGSSRDRIGGARRRPRAKVAPALRIPIGCACRDSREVSSQFPMCPRTSTMPLPRARARSTVATASGAASTNASTRAAHWRIVTTSPPTRPR